PPHRPPIVIRARLIQTLLPVVPAAPPIVPPPPAAPPMVTPPAAPPMVAPPPAAPPMMAPSPPSAAAPVMLRLGVGGRAWQDQTGQQESHATGKDRPSGLVRLAFGDLGARTIASQSQIGRAHV